MKDASTRLQHLRTCAPIPDPKEVTNPTGARHRHMHAQTHTSARARTHANATLTARTLILATRSFIMRIDELYLGFGGYDCSG